MLLLIAFWEIKFSVNEPDRCSRHGGQLGSNEYGPKQKTSVLNSSNKNLSDCSHKGNQSTVMDTYLRSIFRFIILVKQLDMQLDDLIRVDTLSSKDQSYSSDQKTK
jgi:hypothetical protein